MTKISNRTAQIEIANLRDFENHTGSFTGNYSSYPDTYNMTPENAAEMIAIFDGKPVYRVYSYKTMIGAVNPRTGQIWQNSGKYSVTTSKHQGIMGVGFHAHN